jgi:CheY-like chemotaxis protein
MKGAGRNFKMRPKSLRILLINDTHGMKARQMVLEGHGHKVVLAPSVSGGLDQLTSQTFDLVVTVYRMAYSSEQQVIEKIRQHDPQILIIVLSGFVEILGLTEQSTGADAVLSKGPHEVQHLLRAIDRLSSRRTPNKPPGSGRTGLRAPKGKTG